MKLIKDLLSLSKVMVSVSVTYTAFAGYVLASGKITYELFFVLAGVFFLSSGASSINHIFERKTDAVMDRTKNRPLPSGRMSLKFAIGFAVFCTISGSLLLYFFSGLLVLLLGIVNLLWYDFIYTPMKRTSVWAVFVGTITGVIPFYMGYLSVFEQFPEPAANFIAVFLLIWQIPHFLLLLGIYGQEYEDAGLASITLKTSKINMFRTASLWLIACCILLFSLPLFGLIHSRTIAYISVGISGFIFVFTFTQLFLLRKNKFKTLFVISNILQLLIITAIIIDRLKYN